MGEGGEVAQPELVVAGDAVGLADGGEQLGLLDGVDAEVGLHVEVELEHVLGIAGLLGDHVKDGFFNGVLADAAGGGRRRRGGRGLRGRGRRVYLGRGGSGRRRG